MKIIEFEDVHRTYTRGEEVLAGVTFAVEAGQIVGLVGRNGAGKTTLMRIAMGMLEAQRGSVRVFGLDPRREPLAVKRQVGYVSEDQILPPYLRDRRDRSPFCARSPIGRSCCCSTSRRAGSIRRRAASFSRPRSGYSPKTARRSFFPPTT